MTTIHDRLDDLAEDAPRDLPATDLWARGRRRRRRQRVASGVLAVLLVLAVGSLSTLAIGTARTPGPGRRRTDGRCPGPAPTARRPRARTPGTDDTGPIGPLSAVVGAERRTSFWGGTTIDLAGVSRGGYSFLDLPGRARDVPLQDPVALSADGRYLAYLLAGAPPAGGDGAVGDRVVGVAVYDTVSGEVLQHRVDSEMGLDVSGLDWAGSTLLVQFGVYTEITPSTSTSVGGRLLRWDLDTRQVTERATTEDAIFDASAVGERSIMVSGRQVSFVDATGAVSDGPRLDVRPEGGVVASPDGSLLAALRDPDAAGTYRGRQAQAGPRRRPHRAGAPA